MAYTKIAGTVLPLAVAVALAGCQKDEQAKGIFDKNGSPNDIVNLSTAVLGDAPSVQLKGDTIVNEGDNFEVIATLVEAETFSWQQISGPSLNISQGSNRTLSLQAPRVSEDSLAVLRMTANNRFGSTFEDIRIVIKNVPIAPTADAGSDATVVETTSLMLTGNASVAVGEPATEQYSWTQISGPQLQINDANTLTPTIIAPEVNADTQAELQFIATGAIASAPDTVTVTILNITPIANAGTVIEVLEGEPFTLDGSASQANGDKPISAYTWRSLNDTYAVGNEEPSNPQRNLIAKGVDQTTEYSFALSVADADDISTEDTVIVRVLNGGDQPIASAESLSVPQATPVTLDASPSSDPKDRALTYYWEQVTADGEADVEFSLADGGKTLQFTSPSIDSDRTLTFRLTVNNGINYSEPTLVNVKVIAQEIYSGQHVSLKGNPYTVIGDKFDLGVSPYSIEVVGDNAYITYHDEAETDGDAHPTGLLVVDIADARQPKIVRNYPITWASAQSSRTTQMRLAVDSEEKYAYIVEKNLLGADADNATGILRIDLSQEADATHNGVQLLKAPEDSDGENFSDIVYRGGKFYALEYSDYGAIYELSIDAMTGDVAFIERWKATAGNTDDVMGTLDVSADGKTAVIMDLYQITTVKFGDDGSALESFEVEASKMDPSRSGRRHIALDASGEFAYATFQSAITSSNPPAQSRYSAVEKIDVSSSIADERVANLRFSSPEQARGVTIANGYAFVAAGQQGVQLLDTANTESLALSTYYQTPMRAIDMSVSIDKNQAFAIGDKALSIIDLISKDKPAMATQWADDFFNNVQDGNNREYPLGATDVEIVRVAEDKEIAVVAQAREENSSRRSSNLLIVDDLGSNSWSIQTIPYGNIFGINNKLRLTEHNGAIYTLYNNSGSSGVHRLSHEALTAANPTPEKFSTDNAYDIAFLNNDIAYLNQGSRYKRWDVATAKEDNSAGNFLYNLHFFEADFSPEGKRLLGAGRYFSEGEGCWLADTAGQYNNFSRLYYPAPELSVVQSGAITNGTRTCHAGFGYDAKLTTAADRDEYRAKAPFGIMSVHFNRSVDQIDSDPASENEDWQDLIGPDSVATQAIYSLPDNPEEIVAVGDRLYVANATFGGVQIINAANPTNLVLEGVLHTEDSAQGLDVNHDQSLVVVADDNMRGIVQIPIEFPRIERTDNDAITALLDDARAIAHADTHAIENQTLTFIVDWSREEYDQVTCYATTDTTKWGNETCTVTPVEGDATAATLTWQLPAGDIDQEIRVAVGNNIEFLSSSFQLFIDKEPVTP